MVNSGRVMRQTSYQSFSAEADNQFNNAMVKTEMDELSVIKVLPENDIEYIFNSVELEEKYFYARHSHLSFSYFLIKDNAIISFALFMNESLNLILGFLEYQVPSEEKRRYLSKNFPALSGETLYLNYIYTENLFRRQYVTTWFIQRIMTEERKIFDYIWLRRETSSTLFNKCGFVNFRNAVEKIIGSINFQNYFRDNKSPALMRENNEFMVNILKDHE